MFEAHGYDAGTTNRIADAAGMSVGSLYQYFPNKDAILVDLMEAHIGDGAERVHTALEKLAAEAAPLGVLARTVVGELLALHRETPVLHQVLMSRTPSPPDVVERLVAVEAHLTDDLAVMLSALTPAASGSNPSPGGPGDPKLAAAMVATAVNAMVHSQVAHPRPPIPDDVFVEETAEMVLAYLTRPA